MPRSMRRALERLLMPIVGFVLVGLARLLPMGALRRLADAIVFLLWPAIRRRARIGRANLAAAFPELSEAERRRILRGAVRNTARTAMELLKLPALSPEELAGMIESPDLAPMREAHEAGHPIICITAHLGNWEYLGAFLSRQVTPMTAVVSRGAANGPLAALATTLRSRHGIRIVPRGGTREMLRVLEAGGMLAMLPDQRPADGGILSELLGRPAWTSPGPAVLAARTGARVFTGFCVRDERGRLKLAMGQEIEFAGTGDRRADIRENTRRVNRVIEEAIRAYPDNWLLWLHNRWKQQGPALAEVSDDARLVQDGDPALSA